MLGAIAGDIIGSVHEFGPPATPETPLFQPRSHFTDDTILTLATARCLVDGVDYATAYREAYQANRAQSWGMRFIEWGKDPSMGPYNSFGNGSAMRVSPIAFWARDLDEALLEAKRSAEVTHDHPEGIRGAQATVHAAFLARQGVSASAILAAIRAHHGYPLDEPVPVIQRTSRYNETCQGTVPPAIRIACNAESFDDAMSICISLDADTDTLACITGGIAEARFGMPNHVVNAVNSRLLPEQRELIERYWTLVSDRLA
ncbi:ADP-ribosylglycohydrolase family protein [Aquisalimonas sp.]|uniref:ADP-ribosylglycohydrolase family protein n=1 Tax=Aquisalimonas sp. TaxID=1872621 RepID=UPI0025BA391C|nr:ADP-ribosylglycohydrolase family protein [Aquisalimonas sp.]